jgi:DNA-binding transcriptional regulator YdaS (Cro superfamily)
MEKPKHPHIDAAISKVGSQKKLADYCGCAQQTISKLLNLEIAIPAEIAVKIEAATNREVPRWKLRPDLWEPPQEQAMATS